MRMPDVNDLIKRGDALEIVKRTNGDYVTAWSNIAALDAIDPESLRSHGRWIAVPSSDMMTGKAYKCSQCNVMRWGAHKPNYCPHCGAKMED